MESSASARSSAPNPGSSTTSSSSASSAAGTRGAGAPPRQALPPARPFAGILAATLGNTGLAARRAGLLGAAHGARGPCSGLEGGPGLGAAHPARGEAKNGEALVASEAEHGVTKEREQGEDTRHDDRARDDRDLDLLDPAARQAALLAPPITTPPLLAATAHAPDASPRARTLEELLPALVKRIAWEGDKHRGTVSFELGAGAHAGTSVTVHAEGSKVRVELTGTEGPELDRLRTRLAARLRQSGLDVESVS